MAIKISDVIMQDKPIQALDKFIDETNGFLHVKGVLARTGIQEYLGRELSPSLEPEKIYGVMRHQDDVLEEESLKGYTNAPVTDDHPSDFVTTENYKELMKGSCSNVNTDKESGIDYVKGHLTIMDGELIQKLKNGKLEISVGYYSDIEPEEGEFLGQPYQFRQKNIRVNHIAIVSRGRCGEKCKIVRDYAIIGSEVQNLQGEKMAKIKIGEVEYEVPEEVAAEFLKLTEALTTKNEEVETMSEDMEEIEKEKEMAVATADELKEQLRALKRTTKDSAIVAEAGKIVKVLQVADSMGVKVEISDEMAMKKSILTAKYPKIDLNGKSADYIAARFDAMIEGRERAEQGFKQVGQETQDGAKVALADKYGKEEY